MGTNLDTRLLLPFLKYFKTQPVIINYNAFAQGCAAIVCIFSFILTTILMIRSIQSLQNHGNNFQHFYDSVDRILQERGIDPAEFRKRLEEDENNDLIGEMGGDSDCDITQQPTEFERTNEMSDEI